MKLGSGSTGRKNECFSRIRDTERKDRISVHLCAGGQHRAEEPEQAAHGDPLHGAEEWEILQNSR